MSAPEHRTTPDDTDRMPGGIPYIVGNEAAERFSFYGMKAILAVFMTKYLFDTTGELDLASEAQATAWISWFNTAVYATPFLGAVIADRYWGKYKTILYLSLVYCAGHLVLALMDTPLSSVVHSRFILLAGLALIALGSGGIKPCVTSHVGDQFGPRNQRLIARALSWFYFSINLGSMISTLLTPQLLKWYGPGWAFGVPGGLMALATFVFWLGRNQFVHIPPAGKQFWTETFGSDGKLALKNLTPLLFFVAMFWSLFDQSASRWVLQAEDMDRHLLTIPSWLTGGEPWDIAPSPSQLQAINPIFVLLMIPVFTYVIYPTLGRFFEVTALRKIGIGLFVAGGSFAITGLAELRIQAEQTPHVSWQILAYAVLTAAEIMVSITMLEFFYTQAPRRMKSLVMAFCLLSVSVGNAFTGAVNEMIELKWIQLAGANYYWFFTGAMLFVATLYVFWSRTYRGQTYIQGEDG